MATVKIRIDGREIEVDGDVNLIEAARKLGILIPHFCYHPGLGVDGNCRMCLVEVEGQPKPAIACNTLARELLTRDGVREVFTTTPKVKEWQRAVLEFLFLNHPLDCPICDQSGECFLQDYYMGHGQYQSRLDLPKVHKRKVVEVGPRVKLDAERCVLCSRCIRFCDQVTGTGELYIVNRGHRSEITHYPGVPLDNEYSLNTVDICPVGALTSSEFRFRKRVWLLSSVHSICTGCARGCNIYLEHDEGTVYRYRPRENMEVNQYWMCDPGRLTYHPLNENRLEVPLEGTEEVPFSEALRRAASWIGEAASGAPSTRLATAAGARRSASSALLLLSPASSVETLFAAKRFAAEVLGGARRVGAGTRPPGVEDRLLRKADPYPNSAGLRLLGLEGDPDAELKAGGSLLIVIEDDPLGPPQRPEWREQFARFDRVLYLGTNENDTSRAAQLALPITPHSECDGTFVNFQDRVQRFRKGITPRGDAFWAPELLRRLAASLGGEFGWANPAALWKDLAATEPAFAGLEWAQLGGTGQRGGRGGAAGPGAAHTVPAGGGAGSPAHPKRMAESSGSEARKAEGD